MNEVIDPTAAQSFFSLDSVALVGASDDKKHFSNAVFLALKDHGVPVIPVNPHEATVGDEICYPNVAAVPGPLDGVIVMVNHETALHIIDECVERGVTHVWLFKGLGGDSAVSDEAIARCRANRIDVIPGACPMMFLQPVKGVHRFHRVMRRAHGAVGKAA